MNEPTPEITIEVLSSYSYDDAAAIGSLLPHLSTSFDSTPVNEQVLRDIIESPYHDQLIARDATGRIIGTATLTITMGAAVARNAWLEDFVVDPTTQGLGVGGRLWDAMIEWCHEHYVHNLGFTSRASRVAAQKFYLKKGAIIRDTNHFKKEIS